MMLKTCSADFTVFKKKKKKEYFKGGHSMPGLYISLFFFKFCSSNQETELPTAFSSPCNIHPVTGTVQVRNLTCSIGRLQSIEGLTEL